MLKYKFIILSMLFIGLMASCKLPWLSEDNADETDTKTEDQLKQVIPKVYPPSRLDLSKKSHFKSLKPLDDTYLAQLKQFIKFSQCTPMHPNSAQMMLYKPHPFFAAGRKYDLYFALQYNPTEDTYQLGMSQKEDAFTHQIVQKQRHYVKNQAKVLIQEAKMDETQLIDVDSTQNWFYSLSKDKNYLLFAHQSKLDATLYDVVFALEVLKLKKPWHEEKNIKECFLSGHIKVYGSYNVKKETLDEDPFKLDEMIYLYNGYLDSYYQTAKLESVSQLSAPMVKRLFNPAGTGVNRYKKNKSYHYTISCGDNSPYIQFQVKPAATKPNKGLVLSIKAILGKNNEEETQLSDELKSKLKKLSQVAVTDVATNQPKDAVLYAFEVQDQLYKYVFASSKVNPARKGNEKGDLYLHCGNQIYEQAHFFSSITSLTDDYNGLMGFKKANVSVEEIE